MNKKNNNYFLNKIILDVKPYDIDAAGHLNNAVYIRWLEDLRIKLLEGIFPLSKLIEKNLYPVVVFTSIRYKQKIKLFNKPEASIEIESLEDFTINLNFKILLKGKLATEAKQKCVICNLASGKMIKLKNLNI